MNNNITEAADWDHKNNQRVAKYPPEEAAPRRRSIRRWRPISSTNAAAKHPPDRANQGRQSIRHHNDGKASVKICSTSRPWWWCVNGAWVGNTQEADHHRRGEVPRRRPQEGPWRARQCSGFPSFSSSSTTFSTPNLFSSSLSFWKKEILLSPPWFLHSFFPF